MLQPSRRGQEMPASPIRRLSGYADEATRRGVEVFHLNIGQPDIHTPDVAIEALHNIDMDVLAYSPSNGLESVRKKFCQYYHNNGIEVSPDEVIITSGGSEAIILAFLACLDPGDEIILPEPAYANYLSFAKTAGVKIVPLPASIDNNFALPSLEEFEKHITPRTRAILICNPNNPTGYVYSRHELEAIAYIASLHNLFIFSDEVYREFCYSDRGFTSVMNLLQVRSNVVMFDSVSKRYSECGIRIGALVTRNSAVRAAVLKLCQARLSPPLLGQIVAGASVDTPESYLKEVYDEYIRRRDFIVSRINAIPGCRTPVPMGAFYTMVELPVDDADKFSRWCLEEFSWEGGTVFMAPGNGFYSDPEKGLRQVRIAYVHDISYLSRALDILEHALEAYNAIRAEEEAKSDSDD